MNRIGAIFLLIFVIFIAFIYWYFISRNSCTPITQCRIYSVNKTCTSNSDCFSSSSQGTCDMNTFKCINIILNILVIFLFKGKPLFMIAGVGLATSLSRILFLSLLVFHAKKEFNFKVKGIGLRAPIFATLIMSAFLFGFNHKFKI